MVLFEAMPSLVSGGLPTRMLLDPPLPPSPWHWLQPCSTNTLAPCAALPLPGGRLVPSGSTLMSHALISASEIGLPRWGESAATASDPQERAPNNASACGLRIDMLDLPAVLDAPSGEAVVVLVWKAEHVRNLVGLAAYGDEIRTQRLHRA